MRRDAAGRPVGERDRHGAPLSTLEWSARGLDRASVRLPDGSWVTIEPGAAAPGPWGASDLVTHDGAALTRLAALDWTRLDRIPPLAEPARLPAGAGTAIFNLLARLAQAQGVPRLRYDAPWPTEALFLALLESFRWVAAEGDEPLGAFARGALAWEPAPHDVVVEAGVWVQCRERVEKVVVGRRAYWRPHWQGVTRRAPRVVRDDGDRVAASLVVLGRVVEDHVVLARDGTVLETPAPSVDPSATAPLAPDIVAGLVATVIATSAPPLAPWIAEVARDLAFEWGPVDADLISTERDRVRLSHRIQRALRDAVSPSAAPADALAVGLAALREAADLVADVLRARAQEALAAQPEDTQVAALHQTAPPTVDARAIAAAAHRLVLSARA
jgi:hypothetical protein